MTQPHHDPAFCTELGKQWIDAWNSHDLERILALYAEDAEMTSDKIPALGFDPSGTVRGKVRVSGDREHGFQRIVSNDFRGS